MFIASFFISSSHKIFSHNLSNTIHLQTKFIKRNERIENSNHNNKWLYQASFRSSCLTVLPFMTMMSAAMDGELKWFHLRSIKSGLPWWYPWSSHEGRPRGQQGKLPRQRRHLAWEITRRKPEYRGGCKWSLRQPLPWNHFILFSPCRTFIHILKWPK